MLGLKRKTVLLKPYSTTWNTEFQQLKKELKILLKDYIVDIEHIGSTSIQGMISKPILDLGIGTQSKNEIFEIAKLLSNNTWIDRGDRKNRGGYLLVKLKAQDVISHHLHILETDDQQWKNYLIFRNSLRENKQLAKEYEELKKQLYKLYKQDRGNYTSGKNKFINRVITENK